jgi:hypothetical protein
VIDATNRIAVLFALALLHGGCALDREGSSPRVLDKRTHLDAGALHDEDDEAHGDPATDAAVFDAAPGEDAAIADADAALDVDAGPAPLCGDDPSLVACYPFDGDALDHGPRGNHLAATQVSWEPSSGVLLQAASGLVRAHRAELSHRKTTLLVWARVDVMPTAGRAGIVDHDGQYGLFVHPGGELRCSNAIAGAGVASAPAALQQGRWQHIACVAEGTTSRLYVDGVMVASVPCASTRTPGEGPLHVGENGPTGDDQLVGAIDDLRIWDAEWTASEVAADARRGR